MTRPNVTRRELQIHQGGLYRCCIQSFEDWVHEAPDAVAADGEKIACRYEPKSLPKTEMVVTGNVVRWFDPDYPPLPKVAP